MTRMQSRHSRLNPSSRGLSFLVALVLTHTSVARAGSGEVDDSFQPVLDESVFANIVLTNGKYLVGGSFDNAGGEGGPEHLARFNADGSLDTTFSPPIKGIVNSIAALSDGKYLVGGSWANLVGQTTPNYLAKLNSDGSVDTGFSPPFLSNTVYSVSELSDGKYLIGGRFTTGGPDYLMRLNPDGSLDGTFTPPEFSDWVYTAIELSTGKYLVGGRFSEIGCTPPFCLHRLVRLNSDGSLDSSFWPPSLSCTVRTVVELSDGKYLIGGCFYNVGGDDAIDKVVRLLPGGDVDTSFVPASISSSSVFSIAPLSDGKFLIGGNMTGIDSTADRDYLARLNSDGSFDNSFNPPALNREVYAVTELSDGNYLIGGVFSDVGGNSWADYLIRLLSNSTSTPSELDPAILWFITRPSYIEDEE